MATDIKFKKMSEKLAPKTSDPSDTLTVLETQLKEIKWKLEQSKMKEAQLNSLVQKQNKQILGLQQENCWLKNQVQELKQAKNKANEQIISLSNRCYQLASLNEVSSSASSELFSNITVQKEESKDKLKGSLFSKKDAKIIHSLSEVITSFQIQQEPIQQKQTFSALNQHFPVKNSNPMKQSLQLNYKQDQQSDVNFIQQIKLMKLKAQRIIGVENDRPNQRLHHRVIQQTQTDRFQIKEFNTPIDILKEKRFKRKDKII